MRYRVDYHKSCALKFKTSRQTLFRIERNLLYSKVLLTQTRGRQEERVINSSEKQEKRARDEAMNRQHFRPLVTAERRSSL